MSSSEEQIVEATGTCGCADAVSLRRELTTIFGVPIVRDGETWNAAMLRQIGGELAHNHRQAKYVKALYEDIAVPLDLLVRELGGDPPPASVPSPPEPPDDHRCPACRGALSYDDGAYFCDNDGTMGEAVCSLALKRYESSPGQAG